MSRTPNQTKQYSAIEDNQNRQLRRWDWVPVTHLPEWKQNALVMLRPLRDTCKDCSMCRLGMNKPTIFGKKVEDQHVFSNMLPSAIMIVGQNPGYNECLKDTPFVGEAGAIFNQELVKYGINRDDLYFTNVTKCSTNDNRKPENDEIETCEPYLKMEIRIVKPKLVVALGAVAFQAFCPDKTFSDSIGTIVKSEKFNVKIFPIYHPSPLNLEDDGRNELFVKHMKLLCGMIIHILK